VYCAAVARFEALARDKEHVATELQQLQERANADEEAHRSALAEMVCTCLFMQGNSLILQPVDLGMSARPGFRWLELGDSLQGVATA